ncbi:hypothetical protein B0H14DRAFT_3743328 [Mycena olivaceomarginata]|nr:hypothetical protein B0H14DRAFT_3743328 [Mycena olivaceomarginata]
MDEAMERRQVDGYTGWAGVSQVLFPLTFLCGSGTSLSGFHIDSHSNARTVPLLSPCRGRRRLTRPRIAHIYNDQKIPDSRYASAVVSDDEGDVEEGVESDSSGFLDELRADPLERTFAIRWLAGLVGRNDTLSVDNPTTDSDEARESLLDEATLLAKFSHQEEDEDFEITRYFSSPSSGKTVHIELNDAPLSTSDHTSVGLQSWGSAIILVERLWTGLLSIAVAKLIPLLANLAVNLHTNFYVSNQSGVRVSAVELDWACPAPGTLSTTRTTRTGSAAASRAKPGPTIARAGLSCRPQPPSSIPLPHFLTPSLPPSLIHYPFLLPPPFPQLRFEYS